MSPVAEYSIEAEIEIDFKGTTVLARMTMYCLMKEATEIWQHTYFSRDMRFSLSCSWYPTMNMIKQRRAIRKHCKEGPMTVQFCPLFSQQSGLEQDNIDCLTPLTVSSMICAGTAQSLFCGINTMFGYDARHVNHQSWRWRQSPKDFINYITLIYMLPINC
jgi:hypothetical protein